VGNSHRKDYEFFFYTHPKENAEFLYKAKAVAGYMEYSKTRADAEQQLGLAPHHGIERW